MVDYKPLLKEKESELFTGRAVLEVNIRVVDYKFFLKENMIYTCDYIIGDLYFELKTCEINSKETHISVRYGKNHVCYIIAIQL